MRMSRLVVVCGVLVSFCLVTSCASHKTAQLPQLTLDANAQQNKVEQGGFVGMVKPIHLKSELMTYFNYDLIADDILPVQINIFNKSYGKPRMFSLAGINLVDRRGNRIPMLSIEQLMDKIQKSYWRSVGWGAAFGLLGAIPAAINVAKTNEKIRVDYEMRTLKNGVIIPGAFIEGVAFFSIHPETKDLTDWELTVFLSDPADSTNIRIEKSITGKIESRSKEDQPTEQERTYY
jgi:hypothetical protein